MNKRQSRKFLKKAEQDLRHHMRRIAEDVAKVEPRLVTFKLTEMNKKDDGSVTYETKELDTPIPVSVNYDRITMHLISIVKRFKTRIETLEG